MGSPLLPAVMLGLIAFQGADDPAPADLIRQLGTTQFSDREEAGAALIKIGPAALPAVKKACESGDPEVRLRAETLISRVKAGEVLNATRITLELRDRPLAEVAEEIAKASGMRIRPGVSGRNRPVDPTWPQRRVTLEAAKPIPFLQFVDRL
jgi:hypothetical protein